MKVGIVGFGAEGQSALKYWQAAGYEVTVLDANPATVLPQGVSGQLGQDYLKGLQQFDVVVRSPGVRPDVLVGAKQVTSVTKEFFARCPAPIIGVTGTKGKGTTASLAAKILEAAGRKVWLGGNIGTPALDFLLDVGRDDLVVLELSSFQLMDLDQSPQIAVCLMIAPEHLNWHKDMAEYLAAKGNIFAHQTSDDLAVYNASNQYSKQLAGSSPARKRPYMDAAGVDVRDGAVWLDGRQVIITDQIGLLGRHNQQNVCAAIAATYDLAAGSDAVVRAVRDFKGLQHRLELVGEIDGVRYYDDSFSTTPETAMAALAAFKQPKVIILGGSSKGADYQQLAAAVAAGGVIKAVLVGDTAPAIAQALEAAGFKAYVTGPAAMTAMVAAAKAAAPAGSVVLLSPACASFDLFKNYKDRGQQFKAAVAALA